jgi:hypothetical protein
MSRTPLLFGAAALVAAALACGGGRTAPPAGTQAAATAPPAPHEVTIDCEALVPRIAACADAFEAAYAKTETAGHAGKAARDAPLDGEKGARNFMISFRHEHNRALGEQMCASWQQRDQRWLKRLAACDPTADCETFSACAAPAIGDPLPVPE